MMAPGFLSIFCPSPISTEFPFQDFSVSISLLCSSLPFIEIATRSADASGQSPINKLRRINLSLEGKRRALQRTWKRCSKQIVFLGAAFK